MTLLRRNTTLTHRACWSVHLSWTPPWAALLLAQLVVYGREDVLRMYMGFQEGIARREN